MAFLGNPRSYSCQPEDVKILETHMSWVFLVEDRVYKLKKPVRYDFLDFSTLEKRKDAVEAEVRLNRRLAKGVYLRARALQFGKNGELTLSDSGEVVEWLVEMRRLPDERCLESLILSNALTSTDIMGVASLLTDFYGSLPSAKVKSNDHVEKFEAELRRTISVLTDPSLSFDDPRLESVLVACEAGFNAAKPELMECAERGFIVEGHGDLRPQHVFLTDPPVIIDCLEFNRSLRLVDPFDEITFLGVECARLGAAWVIDDLAGALERALKRRRSLVLLSFYWRYRALLRARLSLMHIVNQPNRTPEKWRPLASEYIGLAEDADLMTRTTADQSPTGSRAAF